MMERQRRLEDWPVVQASELSQGAVAMTIRRILFICTGNTGRSVAAEALCRSRIATLGLPLAVISRGVAVNPANLCPETPLMALLAARGIDIAPHRAAPLTEADVRDADCILTMTVAHKRCVLARFPAAAGKLHMLSEAAHGVQRDVADAFGAPASVYEQLVAQVDVMVADTLDKAIL